MATTRVYKGKEDFVNRADKEENGVSEEFALRYPHYRYDNDTNKGCWNCLRCTHCKNLDSCTMCWNSRDSKELYDCIWCYGCQNCEGCRGCQDCLRCENCLDCEILADNKNVKGGTGVKSIQP